MADIVAQLVTGAPVDATGHSVPMDTDIDARIAQAIDEGLREHKDRLDTALSDLERQRCAAAAATSAATSAASAAKAATASAPSAGSGSFYASAGSTRASAWENYIPGQGSGSRQPADLVTWRNS